MAENQKVLITEGVGIVTVPDRIKEGKHHNKVVDGSDVLIQEFIVTTEEGNEIGVIVCDSDKRLLTFTERHTLKSTLKEISKLDDETKKEYDLENFERTTFRRDHKKHTMFKNMWQDEETKEFFNVRIIAAKKKLVLITFHAMTEDAYQTLDAFVDALIFDPEFELEESEE